ncbi:MAG: extracellular solute-binding protein [Pseudomonadota bacterium]
MTITRRQFGRLGLGASGLLALPAALKPGLAGASAPRHGISAFDDLAYGPDFTHFAYANPDAPKGGTFSTGFGGVTFDSLNPFILKGNPAIGLDLTLDTLMAPADDEPDAMYALVAETATVAEDHSAVEFALHPEARFADGSPITPDDVLFTVEALQRDGHPRYRIALQNVSATEVTGARSIRFAFDTARPLRDMPMIVAGLPVLSRAGWEGRNFADTTLDPILTSGPYSVEDAEPGRRITYRRREDYWARDLPVNRGRHNFDRIRIEYFRDRSATFEGFKAGAFTFYEEFWSKLWATAYDFPAIQRGDVKREEIPDQRPAGTQGFWFNLRREKFADPRTREAIASVFDFEWSNRTLFFDLYTRTDSLFEGGGALEAAGAPTPAELALLEPLAADLPAGVLEGAAYVPPVSDGSGRIRRTLRNAAKLLDEAGWSVVDGTRTNAAGEPLEIEFLLVSEGFGRITTPYIKNLERIGIKATARTIDPAQYKRRTDDFDFDITVQRYAMSLTPGVELRDYFYSANANTAGSRNLAGVDSPVVDHLIDVIERAEDRESLNAAVRALDRVLRAMHIWVPQWSKAAHHIAYWDIYGRPEIKPAYDRGVIGTWWIDSDKQARLADQIGE